MEAKVKHGFYAELIELQEENPDANFGFLENVRVSDEWNAFDYLHGRCDEFAAMLSEAYGYEIETVHNADKELIHSYCTTEINGGKAYIDVRGITVDRNLFWMEFEDEVTSHGDELWASGERAIVEAWASKAELFNGGYRDWSDKDIRKFILNSADYYDASKLEERSGWPRRAHGKRIRKEPFDMEGARGMAAERNSARISIPREHKPPEMGR